MTLRRAMSSVQTLEGRVGVVLLVLLLVPIVIQGQYAIQLLNLAMVYAIVAIGLNIVLGYSGQISIAQAALAAIGAYTSALLVMRAGWPWLAAAATGVAAASVAGALLGILTYRVRTHYLLLVTIGFHIVVVLIIVNEADLTGGPVGLYPIPPIQVGDWVVRRQEDFFALAAPLLVLLIYAAERIRSSRVGLAMFAIQASEKGARAAGIDPMRYRIIAMALGGLYAGVGGVLFAGLIKFLGPESFDLRRALFYVVIVVLGGMGRTWGVVGAAVILTLLSEQLRTIADIWILLYGGVVMLFMAVAPGGMPQVVTQAHRLWQRRSRDRDRRLPTAPPAETHLP